MASTFVGVVQIISQKSDSSYWGNDNVTQITEGDLKWGIAYDKVQAEKIENVLSITEYDYDDEHKIYLYVVK